MEKVLSLHLHQLRSAQTLSDLARILGVKPSTISWLLYQRTSKQNYTRFTVPKKNGGIRAIDAPEDRLKAVQRRLADLLSQIEIELEQTRAKRECILSHGFKKKSSIITNAKNHRNRRWVFNVDLQDFFPSINFGRVRGFFIRSHDFQLSPSVATVIAQIACLNNSLPQGSPCSPVISNLVTHILDIHLSKMASRLHCTYTRYADDLTFSTNKRDFPASIAARDPNSNDFWLVGPELSSRISRAGFRVHPDKVRMQRKDSRQTTTGLIVNRKINVTSDYYKLVRAMCHHLFQDGRAHDYNRGKSSNLTRAALNGMLAHIFLVRGMATDHKKIPSKKDQPGFYRLYSRFLDYTTLYSTSKPVLICEGKTDYIYIKSAIKSMASKYPSLIDNTGGDTLLKIKQFKYTKLSSTLQDLSGGTGQLLKLLNTYESRIKGFKTGLESPLIMIVDADKGSTDIFKSISSKLGKSAAGFEPFYYMGYNLYVVPVPKLPASTETAIEDLFPAHILATEIGGKQFDRTNEESDGKKYYGKFVFATQVVAKNSNTIDFSGFETLLNAVNQVINDYASRISKTAVAA